MYAIFLKRLLDVVVSSSALVILSPILLCIAILIKIFDPGPIIFLQTRVGLGGTYFCFYKFRSMPVNTGDIPSDKLGLVRLTWVGKLLRRSNLDELPQLYNILRGDMSLVGPRPCLSSQEELINLRRANGALSCRPGLTGLAQVSSYDGMPVSAKAMLDGQYAAQLSFFNDAVIVLRTFRYVLKPPPVY